MKECDGRGCGSANFLASLSNVKKQNGAAIRAIRKAQKIKLVDLARRVGVTDTHLSHVEANRRHASQQLINSIARELAEPVEAIMRNPS